MSQDLRIFVVDDQPMTAYTLSAVLRTDGYNVIPYTQPLHALRDARSLSPNILISDVEMPVLGGVDLAIQLLTICPSCKILLMSGHAGPIKSLEEARAQGFHFPLLEKPLSAQTLAQKLESFSPQTSPSNTQGGELSPQTQAH